MPVSQPTLILATLVLAMSAATLGWHVGTRRVHRAFRYWAWGLGLNACGLMLLMATAADKGPHAFAMSLLLPWPVLAVAGLRGFDARMSLWGSPKTELLLGTAVAAAAWAAAATGLPNAWPYWALQGVVTLYASLAFWRAGQTWRSPLTQALATGWLLTAAGPAAAVLTGRYAAQADFAQICAITVGSTMLAIAAPWLSSRRTERQLRVSRRKLQILANTDMLTQVSNRRHFEELAARALLSDEAENAALVLIDIDHFKRINDELGHAAGDRALRLVSRSAQQLLRAQDLAGRHGGDEFALLLQGTSADEAMRVAQRLVAHIQARSHDQALPRLSLSFGIVQLRRGEGIDDALRRADQALYEAKRLGRSRAVSADGDEEQPEFHSSQRLGLTPH